MPRPHNEPVGDSFAASATPTAFALPVSALSFPTSALTIGLNGSCVRGNRARRDRKVRPRSKGGFYPLLAPLPRVQEVKMPERTPARSGETESPAITRGRGDLVIPPSSKLTRTFSVLPPAVLVVPYFTLRGSIRHVSPGSVSSDVRSVSVST